MLIPLEGGRQSESLSVKPMRPIRVLNRNGNDFDSLKSQGMRAHAPHRKQKLGTNARDGDGARVDVGLRGGQAARMRRSTARRRIRTWLFALCAAIGFCAEQPPDAAAENQKAETRAPALLLANVWNASIDPTDWWMSEKYDGVRGLWDGQKLWTRQGNEIRAPDYFRTELPAHVALDGELWIGRAKFEETISVVRSQTPDNRWKQVRFMVFDAPQAPGTFEERMTFLRELLPAENQYVQPVPHERCRGKAHLLAERDRIEALGGEGLMLRKPESKYDAQRSPTLLKVKSHEDAEATVIAHLPGKRKFAGKLGALRVETPDGRRFSVGSGFTDAQRESPPPVGAVITYRYRGLTEKGLPRFPTFLRVRRD